MLDIMDCRTQTGLKMSLENFVKYYRSRSRLRKRKILNVLSLEFSKTKLQDIVQAPKKVSYIFCVADKSCYLTARFAY